MDLSSNVCSLCCSVESKRMLRPLVRKDDASHEEFVRKFLGSCQVSGALTCGKCEEILATCQEFRSTCRRNLKKVRMIQEEGRGCQVPDSTSVIVKIERDGIEFFDNSVLTDSIKKSPQQTWFGSPDSRRPSGNINSGEKRETESMDDEDSLEEKTKLDEKHSCDIEGIKSEDIKNDNTRAKRREKAVQSRKGLYQVNSPSEAACLNRNRVANRMRNVRYRERKRALSDSNSELLYGGEDNDNTAPININVTPDVSLVVEEGYRAYPEGEEDTSTSNHLSSLTSPDIKPTFILPTKNISSRPSKVIVPTSSPNIILPAPFPVSASPMPILLRGVSGQGTGAAPDVLYLTPVTTSNSTNSLVQSTTTCVQATPTWVQATTTCVRATPTVDPEERRRARNREASKRYREKARGDPGLLLRMREQQNKRQKKYYARLREKKYHSDGSSNCEAKDTYFSNSPHLDWSTTEGGLAITPVDEGVAMEEMVMAFDQHKPSISIIKHEYKPIENTKQ